MKHNINFPDMSVAEDVPYTLKLLCESKNFLCLPNLVYIYRIRANSQCHIVLDAERRVKHRVRSVFKGIKYLDEYMSGIDFFLKRPDFRYAVLNFFKELQSYDVLQMYEQIPAPVLDPLIRRELDEVKNQTALTAFLFAGMNVFNVRLNQQNLMIRQMDAHIKKQNQMLQQQHAYIENLQAQLKALQA